MMTLFMSLDAMLCILVVLAALDLLRAVHLFEHPILSLSFYLIAVGAFGICAQIVMTGYVPSPWSVVLHAGVVTYAAAKRRQIFVSDWQWNGQERRATR